MRRGRTGLAAAVAVALLAGCGVQLTPEVDASGTPDPTPSVVESAVPLTLGAWIPDAVADPFSVTGPSTATIDDDRVAALEPAPVPQLPVTVTSTERAGDREVEVTDVSRIVTMDMSGSLAATVWALGLGDHLVGRDVAAEFPGTEDLPVITGAGHTVTPEAVLALEPTLVLTDGSIGPSNAITQLRDAGITAVYVENESTFAGAGELVRQVAAALGVAEAGEQVAQRIATEVDEARELIATVTPDEGLRMVFLYLRGTAGVYYLFGSESGADDLVDALGGVDVAEEIGLDGMKPLTDEAMLAADPDVILVMTKGLESVGGVDGLMDARPAIALTTAGQNRRIVDMADNQILAFGPRSASILDALAQALYAPEG